MEALSVKDIVRENKKNAEMFDIFMAERIIFPGGVPGGHLCQFLTDEFRKGRVPLRGEMAKYDPVKEQAIVVVPREWGANTPDELVGAIVGVEVIGTIPIAEDQPDDGEILVVRLTEPGDGDGPADWVRFGNGGLNETDVHLGWDVWVDYPPGIPSAFPEEEPEPDPDDSDDSDGEGYW